MPVQSLKEFISLWYIYLSLLDENSFKSHLSVDASLLHLGSHRTHLPLYRTVFPQS